MIEVSSEGQVDVYSTGGNIGGGIKLSFERRRPAS